jgi:hypothetical protein
MKFSALKLLGNVTKPTVRCDLGFVDSCTSAACSVDAYTPHGVMPCMRKLVLTVYVTDSVIAVILTYR